MTTTHPVDRAKRQSLDPLSDGGATLPSMNTTAEPALTASNDEAASPDYLPDRYDRLKVGAEEYASGTDFGDGFWTGDMVRAVAADLTAARVLDGLTDHDADTVSMLTILDAPRGFRHMAWRLTNWPVDRQDDNEFAVISVLARVLAVMAAAFVGEEFEIAQGHLAVAEQLDEQA